MRDQRTLFVSGIELELRIQTIDPLRHSQLKTDRQFDSLVDRIGKVLQEWVIALGDVEGK